MVKKTQNVFAAQQITISHLRILDVCITILFKCTYKYFSLKSEDRILEVKSSKRCVLMINV